MFRRKKNKQLINKVFAIANNAIYFSDSHLYIKALWEVCLQIKPNDETIGKYCFMEDGSTNTMDKEVKIPEPEKKPVGTKFVPFNRR